VDGGTGVIGAPDYVEPVLGWRMWYAVDHGGPTRLSSVVHTTVWEPGLPLVATCRRIRIPLWPFGRGRHDAPGADCRCGIYAATVSTLRSYLPEQLAWTQLVPVVGRVALWGVVQEHEHGWRASFAYPQSLFVPVAELGPGRARRLLADLDLYGVPVYAVDGGSADAVIDEVESLAAA
jgi:hypothetical protein